MKDRTKKRPLRSPSKANTNLNLTSTRKLLITTPKLLHMKNHFIRHTNNPDEFLNFQLVHYPVFTIAFYTL